MRRLAIRTVLALGMAGLPLAPAAAQNAPATPPAAPAAAPAAAASLADAEAAALVKAMAAALAKAPRFAVTIDARYDVVQDSGEKVEFGSRRTLTVNRPAGLRVDAQDSDGRKSAVRFDGKTIGLLDRTLNVYGLVDFPGTTDEALRHMVGSLGLRMPLALLFLTTLPQEIERRARSVALVERDALAASPTDHVAVRAGDVDVQVWIGRGERPLPRRIVITYREEPGQPQFRADLTDWNFAPDVSPARFAFTPPRGAERIPFMVQVEAPAASAGNAATPAAGAPQ